MEFSFRTREAALKRFREEKFDLLVIGGGITGAGTVRDAASRGLKVALVEKGDFAWGTSSRSSKLIHGGLRYLQNMELGLVFEALSERAHLLRTVPHMVRPLPFFLPVYRGDSPGRFLFSFGLWLYDLLSLFRTPGFHRRFSKRKFLKEIPFLKEEGLLGGFRYYDASMWDDVLAIETLRSAYLNGAAIANYTEAVAPLWENDRIVGFQVQDVENPDKTISLHAGKVVVCAGPWTDQVGVKLSPRWHRWLNPSKGVHLIFDLKKIPVPGAVVMSHPEDGRVSFAIPRPDYGAGVVIVGTTDGPTPLEPEKATIEPTDVEYLMDLLKRYFPTLNLSTSDILSAYIGVRPLMGTQSSTAGSEGQTAPKISSEELQKVSREHYIGLGPGGVILAAGGKYTTHRLMAREIVDFALKRWRIDAGQGRSEPFPDRVGRSRTEVPVNPMATTEADEASRKEAAERGWKIPEALWTRYGAEALEIVRIWSDRSDKSDRSDRSDEIPGFPFIEAQLRHLIRTGMVMHLEDFYLRRIPLFATRRDHGLPWGERLARIWAEERGLPETAAGEELQRLKEEFTRRDSWREAI